MLNPVPLRLIESLDDPYDRILADSILGTSEASAIYRPLRDFCHDRLGVELADVTYCSFSVGAGFGLALSDGQRVFLKAWSRDMSGPALDAVHTVQAALSEQEFPAPGVLLMPEPFMVGRATVMQWLDRGAQADASRPALRRAMAETLARLIALAAPYVGLPDLPRHSYPEGGTWGPTHNALFDFGSTGRGAEWIDEIAVESAEVARNGAGRLVLGHRDWRVQNVRFEHDAAGHDSVSAVYDWDALVIARETEIVGMAAATFTNTDETPVERSWPTPTDMVAFIRDYESATGCAFTAGEWRTAGAAAMHLLAYTARCEHCYGDRSEAESAQGILRQYADADSVDLMRFDR